GIPAVILYTLATGAAPATVRAAVMAALVFAGIAAGRATHGPTIIAVTALAILGAAPAELHDPSLQLSFAAVLAIACAARPARAWLAPLRREGSSRIRRVTAHGLSLVLASAAALIVGAP